MAMRHSTGVAESVTLTEEKDINNCKVKLDNGICCTAVYNPFTCLYYADDKYGIIPQTND